MKVKVTTYKAENEHYLRDQGLGDFVGEHVTATPVLEFGSDEAKRAIQNALAELESGRADQVEITRVLEA